MNEMRCEKCQGPIAKGKEAVLTDDEKTILNVGPGSYRLALFKHADPAECRQPDGRPSEPAGGRFGGLAGE